MFSVCLFQCLNLYTERVQWKQKKTRGRVPSFLRAGGGGGGVWRSGEYSDIFFKRRLGPFFFLFKILNFNIFWGFQKIEYLFCG